MPDDELDEERLRTESVARGLVGLDESAATTAAVAAGCSTRVGIRDGNPYVVTMDYRPSRITFAIEAGRVVAADVG